MFINCYKEKTAVSQRKGVKISQQLLTPCDVQIKEVAVENSLNTSRYNSNQVKESFKVVAVDPVEDIQTTVDAKRKQIVAGNTLSLSSLAYHEQLRQDCNRLQVNRKGPKNLKYKNYRQQNSKYSETTFRIIQHRLKQANLIRLAS